MYRNEARSYPFPFGPEELVTVMVEVYDPTGEPPGTFSCTGIVSSYEPAPAFFWARSTIVC